MSEVIIILGGEDNIDKVLLIQFEKLKLKVIGLLIIGLIEIRGDDMECIFKKFREEYLELDGFFILNVFSLDYKGFVQDGFVIIVECIVGYDYGEFIFKEIKKFLIIILVGFCFVFGDVQEIKDIVEDFGFILIVVLDLFQFLDGYLIDDIYSVISLGGIIIEDLCNLCYLFFIFVIGESM